MVLFFIGILLTQLLYVISNWRQYRRADYMIYAVYISLFVFYLVSIFPGSIIANGRMAETMQPFADMVKRPLAILLYLLYFKFMDIFLELKEKYPRMHRQVELSYRLIISFFIAQIMLVASSQAFTTAGNIIYFGLSIVLFSLSVAFMIIAYRQKNILAITLIRGSICVSTGAFITNLVGIYSVLEGRHISLTDYIPFFAGILFELFFFNLALAYKIVLEENELAATQRLFIGQLKENQQLIMEQQQIRNKMARDLHDEVGATLSGVTLFGQLALRNIAQNKLIDIRKYIDRISYECKTMADKINDILWTTKSENDSLEKLFAKLQSHVRPICVYKEIELKFTIDEDMNNAVFASELRNHLYLFCKEAINNAVKYANAGLINFSATRQNGFYVITVEDDGKGFDVNAEFEGNGLKNMQNRSMEIGAEFVLQSHKDRGTILQLKLKSP